MECVGVSTEAGSGGAPLLNMTQLGEERAVGDAAAEEGLLKPHPPALTGDWTGDELAVLALAG